MALETKFFDAIAAGDNKGVAQLLSKNHSLVRAMQSRRTALHWAAICGHDTVVAQLLAACPELASVVDQHQRTALHLAVGGFKKGDKVVAQLLAARPSLIDAVDTNGWTVLHYTCSSVNNVSLAERFLATREDLAFATDKLGNTPLHVAARKPFANHLLERLIKLNPEAMRRRNRQGATPFAIAVMSSNDRAIELMQSRVTFGEIVDAFVAKGRSVEPFRPAMDEQCEGLLAALHQDVVGTVYEYLAFEQTVSRRREG